MNGTQFHPKKTLVLQPITNGAQMWSVAFAQNTSLIVVDAWSPVMEKYRQRKKDNGALETESLIAGCAGMKPRSNELKENHHSEKERER
jgi:hypothetical protein